MDLATPPQIDVARVQSAYATAKELLLAERVDGHWVGELSTSALSTATAISALALVSRERRAKAESGKPKADVQPLIEGGIKYLVEHQNDDGGWGDTDKSYSNIATTYLCVAAIHLAGRASEFDEQLRRANQYIESKGKIEGLKARYGVDKTFVVPILTNCALAGLVPWSVVDPLPFELACVPQSWYRFVGMPVVSYAIPALVAIGQARYFHVPPRNLIIKAIRSASVSRSLQVLRQMQPASGGYLEAVPLTSFVVMSLAAIRQRTTASGGRQSPGDLVLEDGVRFLIDSVRPNGGWPIDTNLATWVTTLALNAFAGAGEDISQYADLDWLLKCQHLERHPFTGAEPGGWGWSDLSGAVPDADDTPGALLAIAEVTKSISPMQDPRDQYSLGIKRQQSLMWLVQLQNRDGGWPTFCRGWGKLPFDRSGVDLTAHAIRAFEINKPNCLAVKQTRADGLRINYEPPPQETLDESIKRGFRFIERNQRPDGSWVPLWFGNQDHPEEENPIYGTAKVLLAYRDTGRIGTPAGQRGLDYLASVQNADGGWGGGASVCNKGERIGDQVLESTVEETALAVEALLAASSDFPLPPSALPRGLAWLCHAVENGKLFDPAPIGFYFAKLWYYERLYPLTFTVSALGRAMKTLGDSETARD